MLKFIQLVVTLTNLVIYSDSAKILAVFPVPSISHQVVFRPLTQELAKRGHEVFVITTDPAFEKGKTPANLTELDVHDFSYEMWKKEFLSDAVTSGNKEDILNQIAVAMNILTRLFEVQLNVPEVQAIIKDKSRKFDLVIVEACVMVALGITHLYDAPVIQISSFGAFKQNIQGFGMSTHPLLHPTSVAQRIYNLTDWEKVVEFYYFIQMERVYQECEVKADDMLRRVIGPDVPSLHKLKGNVDMLFLNVHPIWEMNRPSPPNVIYMGGLHQKAVKELPKDLKSYLDSSKNGVIYISFGTNVEPALLPPERIQKLVNVLSRLPYDILWKWNKDELPGRTKKIKISKWLPQSDLLRHPKIKLFITQGGLQSTDESITAGVPLIGIPLLGDQWYNVEQYVYHKIGLNLDMETITEENIENSIMTIISNERTYRKNVAKLRTVMRDQPETPLNRAVWWTEYIIRHKGAKHLRSPSANMTLVEYFELHLVLRILLAAILVTFVFVYSIFSVLRYICQYKTIVKVKKN